MGEWTWSVALKGPWHEGRCSACHLTDLPVRCATSMTTNSHAYPGQYLAVLSLCRACAKTPKQATKDAIESLDRRCRQQMASAVEDDVTGEPGFLSPEKSQP